MKKSIKAVFMIFISVCGTFTVSGQQHSVIGNMQKIINEKIRDERLHPKEQEKKAVKPRTSKLRTQQVSDYSVSGITEIESEIHAAINPVDSNNMVCSSNT